MKGSWAVLLLCICVCYSVTGFVLEEITDCCFGDEGTNVTFNYQLNFNRQPIVVFSKDDRMFLPSENCILQLRRVADDICLTLNHGKKDMVKYIEEKERKCGKEVAKYWGSTVQRTAKPSMKVFIPDTFRGQASHTLVCQVWGFYPSDIIVSWLKNDVTVSNLSMALPNGDWTYQTKAELNLIDSLPDDEYKCVVQHPSLENKMTITWKQGFTSTQIVKICISSVIFALGSISAITGLLYWTFFKQSGYIPIQGYNDVD
ncbi:HLA class II histocompatibility antigen, DM beta chain isoform X1 [Pelobates cultripes]|uniref:HLA class II histocompatibility antigen, DM beta chain isoform X1 n=1 Tax=Pelobates cultripes TaxID=61616 RepID=A0AAD1T3I0_PELCU|nr:HLA class II histocompatibility antigen, DM beta chain isoform X1 [Pelobates cultripes]